MQRKTFAFGLSAVFAITLVTVQVHAGDLDEHRAADRYVAQWDGPPDGAYGGPDEDGGYGYGPPGGLDAGYSGRPGRTFGNGRSTSYQGFRISDPGDPEQLAAIQHQIDIVDSVGFSRANLQMFRRQAIRSGGRSHFDQSSVILGDLQGKESRPVLLHELLHIYHRQHLPGGFKNPTIMRFYNEAVAGNLYPAGSYVLKDQREFFAMTASAYLNGTIGRSPFNRETVAQQQPAYYAYLGQLFGPR